MDVVKSPDPTASGNFSHSNHLTFMWVFHTTESYALDSTLGAFIWSSVISRPDSLSLALTTLLLLDDFLSLAGHSIHPFCSHLVTP